MHTHTRTHAHGLWRIAQLGPFSWVCSSLSPDLLPASFCSQGTKVCQESGACPVLLPQRAGLRPNFLAPFCTEDRSEAPSARSRLSGGPWWEGLGQLLGMVRSVCGVGRVRAWQVRRSSAGRSLAQPPCGPDGACGAQSPPAHLCSSSESWPAGQAIGPPWLSQASWGAHGAMWARRAPPTPVAMVRGRPASQVHVERTPGCCVWAQDPSAIWAPFTGPACPQDSADGLLCLHRECMPAGAHGGGGDMSGERGRPPEDMGQRERGTWRGDNRGRRRTG